MENLNLGLVELNGKVVVSSRDIARVFEKRHDNVLRDIKNILDGDTEWGLLNFEEMSYADGYSRNQKEFAITRDGFTLLVMGYTGEKAMAFKKAYISAFNEMERRIQSGHSIPELVNNPQLLMSLLTKHMQTQQENQRLQLTEAKYKGQCDTVGLYRIGEIAAQLGINAMKLNSFLYDCRVQYRPNGSPTWGSIPNTWRTTSPCPGWSPCPMGIGSPCCCGRPRVATSSLT